jgi:hypothetical protein
MRVLVCRDKTARVALLRRKGRPQWRGAAADCQPFR